MAHIIVKANIYVEGFTWEERKKIFEATTYNNPAYYLKARMGLSTWKIPKTISTSTTSIDDTRIKIMRGEFAKIRHILPNAVVTEEVESKSFDYPISYVNTSFDLDPFQRSALDSIINKKQGIVHAETSAGKTAIIAAAIAAKGVTTILIANRKLLLSQLKGDLKTWLPKAKISMISASSKIEESDIYIVTDKSLKRIIEKNKKFPFPVGMLIMDEVHFSAAPTVQFIASHVPAMYRFGFTGTLERKDQMDFMIYAAFGRVIARISKDDLLSLDRVTPVVPEVIRFETDIPDWYFEELQDDDKPMKPTRKWMAINQFLHEDIVRTKKIARITVERLKEDPKNKIMVLSRYVDVCSVVQRAIKEIAPDETVHIITGSEPQKKTDASYEDFKNGKCKIIVGTIQCLSTGLSVSDLTHIIIMSPLGNNDLLLQQIRGRLMRKAEGKEVGILIYISDENIFGTMPERRFKRVVNS